MRVAVIGAGCSRYGDRLDAGLKELWVEAWMEAIESVDFGIDTKEIGEAFVGCLSSSGAQIGNVAGMMVDYSGLCGIPASRIENACASGGFALRSAIMSLLSGLTDVCIAGGVEKMRDISGERARAWLGVAGDTEWERWHGMTFPGIFALVGIRHMHEYGTKREDFARVSVKNHWNAARNPKAMFQAEIKIETVLKAPMVAYPLGLYDCCPTADGASVLILCREEDARKYTDSPVYITGWGAATDRIASFHRKTLTSFSATILASRDAYKMAKIQPEEVDFAEVHDCFTPVEIVHYEDLGFCKKGEGKNFIDDAWIGGKLPVNPSGGLKAKGHPIGATGAGQIYEIFRQLRGEAEKPSRQVKGEIALAHIMGGFGVSCTIHILRR
jgi:acetyl-CoA C-acetyltransferase/acetyl-CoA acyltransferase